MLGDAVSIGGDYVSVRKFGGARDSGGKAGAKPDIAFGDTIRDYRLAANLDQNQVGRACGLTRNTVSNWENGVSRPDLALIPTLCKLLSIPLDVFFRMPGYSSLRNDERGILADYRNLTEPNKNQLRKTLDAILESQEIARKEAYRRDFRRLVGHDIGLAAGFGEPSEEEPDAYPVFVRASRDACRADDVFPVNGESMEPDFPDGSTVFVQRTDRLSYGDIVACVVSGVPYVKIYEKDGLHSINKKYSVIRVTDDDDTKLIGRVVGLVPDEDMATEAETTDLMEVFADD